MAHRSKISRDKEASRSRPPAPAEAPEIASPSPTWRRHTLPLLVLFGLALLAYSDSFRSGLVFDNYYAIGKDTRIRQVTSENLHLIFTQDYWYKTSATALYRPLTTLSYLFNYSILGNGASPAGYHWVNLAIHYANIALVYLLGLLLFAEFWPAFAMAAIWAVHPVLTESVTNIVGRADLLAAFGVLAGLLCYVRSLTGGRRSVLWLLALMGATLIAVFSKESGIVIVAVVVLYDLAFRPTAPPRTRLLGYLAISLPVAAFLLVRSRVLATLPAGLVAFTDNPLVGADFVTSRLTAVKVLGMYLWRLVWPVQLSCDYSYNQIPLVGWHFNTWADWKAIVALMVCAGAAGLAAYCYRRSKPIFFLIAFFFVTMAPTANLVILIGTIMAERLLYLPSIGFAGCVAWAGWIGYQRLLTRWPMARVVTQAALAIVCLAFCARTFARNLDWFDEKTLWSSAVRVCPSSYKAHQHLAVLLAIPGGPMDDARAEIDRSLAILEPLPDVEKPAAVYATAGACYRAKGDSLGASGVAWYRKALEILLQGRRVDKAFYQDMAGRNSLQGKTVALTGWSPVYLELGKTYRSLGEYQPALEAFEYGRRINPRAEFFEQMAATYRAMGDAPQAAVSLLEGITMQTDDQTRLAAEVVNLYRQTAPESCALTGNGNSTGLNFNCPLVRSQLCTAGRNVANLYHQMQREADAVATATGAIRSLGCPVEMFR